MLNFDSVVDEYDAQVVQFSYFSVKDFLSTSSGLLIQFQTYCVFTFSLTGTHVPCSSLPGRTSLVG